MNILQIVPNRGWGGGEKCVLELSEGLILKGNNITVVRPTCPTLKVKFKDINSVELNIKFFCNLVAVSALAKIIKKNNIEIVHCHIFKHAFAALLCNAIFKSNIKVVMTRHLCRKGKTSSLYKWLYSKIDKIAFVSGVSKEEFVSTNPSIVSEKMTVIHNSIKIGEPLLAAETNSVCTIGIIGRVTKEKGVKELIEAINICNSKTQNDFYLKIAGTGDKEYMELLKNLIKECMLEDKVEFVGFVNEVLPFMNSVDIVTTPSLVTESFSLTTLEAMYCGKAILASNGGQREMITNGKEGIILENVTKENIAKGLIELIDNKTRCEQLGKAAKERFDREFNFEKYVEKYIDLYEQL